MRMIIKKPFYLKNKSLKLNVKKDTKILIKNEHKIYLLQSSDY